MIEENGTVGLGQILVVEKKCEKKEGEVKGNLREITWCIIARSNRG